MRFEGWGGVRWWRVWNGWDVADGCGRWDVEGDDPYGSCASRRGRYIGKVAAGAFLAGDGSSPCPSDIPPTGVPPPYGVKKAGLPPLSVFWLLVAGY